MITDESFCIPLKDWAQEIVGDVKPYPFTKSDPVVDLLNCNNLLKMIQLLRPDLVASVVIEGSKTERAAADYNRAMEIVDDKQTTQRP